MGAVPSATACAANDNVDTCRLDHLGGLFWVVLANPLSNQLILCIFICRAERIAVVQISCRQFLERLQPVVSAPCLHFPSFPVTTSMADCKYSLAAKI